MSGSRTIAGVVLRGRGSELKERRTKINIWMEVAEIK